MAKMRALGFAIPDDVKAVLKNDAEIMETNNTIIAQAVEMQKGGLIMDGKYFTEQTGIPVAPPVVPVAPFKPPVKLDETVKNKLEKIYNKTNCNHAH